MKTPYLRWIIVALLTAICITGAVAQEDPRNSSLVFPYHDPSPEAPRTLIGSQLPRASAFAW
jgi:hypothetical protein